MNILFLAFEGEANSMGRLAQRFKAKGHRVLVASCDHFTVTHTRGEVYQHYRSLGLADSEFTNLDTVYRQINDCPKDLPDSAVDWQFLRRFESTYCKRFTLLELVAMDPSMSGAYHHRNIYYRPTNKVLFFKFLELHLKWLEGIFQRLRFDAVFTMNFQYFIKAAAFTMAEALSIPFLMVSTCRIRDLHLLYDNFSLGTPRSVSEEMRRLHASHDPCRDAIEYMKKLKEEQRPAYSDFEATLQLNRQRLSLKTRLHELWRYLYRYPRKAIFIDKHYRGWLKRNYFLPSYFSVLRVTVISIWRRFAYFRHPELVREKLPESQFVYFPLHLIPENSVMTLSKTFNEMECLFQLSKALPSTWKVVVKINPNMLIDFDTHPNRYYLELSRLPNVQFVSPLVPSVAIIDKAAAVACISGTALFEGAVLGKPGFRWGRTEFEEIDTIYEFDPARLRIQLAAGSSRNLKYYIQACFNLGLRLDLSLLNYPLTSFITPQQQEEYDRQLSLIENLITEGLAMRTDARHPAQEARVV